MKKLLLLFSLLFFNSLSFSRKEATTYQTSDKNLEVDECNDCLSSAAESCIETSEECVETEKCAGWLSCAAICDHQDEECSTKCDVVFVESYEAGREFKFCVCEMCWRPCKNACKGE